MSRPTPSSSAPDQQPEQPYPTSAVPREDLQTALLRSDAMTLAMRLYLEPMESHAPETFEVMSRWRPLVEAEIARVCAEQDAA